jgi:prevent-host-death family protein
MAQVNVHEAKTHLSRLLARVEAGEDILIAKRGKPVAVLTRYRPGREGRRVLGRDQGYIEVPDDFDDPLPDEVLRSFHE